MRPRGLARRRRPRSRPRSRPGWMTCSPKRRPCPVPRGPLPVFGRRGPAPGSRRPGPSRGRHPVPSPRRCDSGSAPTRRR
ncbi:hypothetical protein E3N94_09690 [Cryobacterium sp. Sr3]|nr:hypothetical protein E3N94_09690 [Cryobacterium sp. Sr3]